MNVQLQGIRSFVVKLKRQRDNCFTIEVVCSKNTSFCFSTCTCTRVYLHSARFSLYLNDISKPGRDETEGGGLVQYLRTFRAGTT